MKKESTKVTKILDYHHINYQLIKYDTSSRLSGEEIATILNEDPNRCFKTLLATSIKSKKYYLIAIPVNKKLDLKKLAKLKNEKEIKMCLEKEMYPLTNYVHGGCSLIGIDNLKISLNADSSFFKYDYVYISAGKIGYQVKINPLSLLSFLKIDSLDLF